MLQGLLQRQAGQGGEAGQSSLTKLKLRVRPLMTGDFFFVMLLSFFFFFDYDERSLIIAMMMMIMMVPLLGLELELWMGLGLRLRPHLNKLKRTGLL